MNGLAHIGVQVHGINKVHIGVLLTQVFHCSDHTDEAFAEVLAAVAGDEDEFLATVEARDIVAGGFQDVDLFIGQGLVALEFIDNHVEGVDNSVAGHKDPAVGLLLLQVVLAQRRGGEVVGGDAAGDLAVHLLRPGAVDVMGAEAGLNVAYGNLLVEGSEGSGGGGGGIAVDQHDIRHAHLEHVAHARQHAGRDVVQVLPLLHDVEVEVRLHLEDPQHLVQHLAVLAGDTDYCLEIFWMFLKLLYQRAHLDGLRAGSKH